MNKKSIGQLAILGVFFMVLFVIKTAAQNSSIDAIKYNAEIEPDLINKSVKGQVSLQFSSLINNLDEITLSAGVLIIDSVTEKGRNLKFEKKENLLKIHLAMTLKTGDKREIKIAYHGTPKYGINFFPEQNQVYTIFSTSQWMPCLDAPSDRATFNLKLNFQSEDVTVVGNGRSVAQNWSLKNKSQNISFEQKNPVPTYLFGFAAGRFRVVKEVYQNTIFQYLAPPQFSEAEVKKIFHDTADMLAFYESKAGVKYPSKTYTQILAAGNAEQEMDSFTALNEEYGRGVLKDEKDIWLGAHEFAHQWWGNMVTNRDWTHFWLNEGLANFMTAAYFEHRFGRAEYLSEINQYKQSYEKVRDAGKDKSLVFPDWNKPTREDRRLIYDKGAYVISLLREELGEELFWQGIKQYTQGHWGKSVETKDFQKSMETASGKDLSKFFDKWIYLKS